MTHWDASAPGRMTAIHWGGQPVPERRARAGPSPIIDQTPAERARRILDELRRKLGDPTRAQEELDYFDRLLRRN